MEDLINKGYMKQFIVRDYLAQSEPVREHWEKEMSLVNRFCRTKDRRSQLPPKSEVKNES